MKKLKQTFKLPKYTPKPKVEPEQKSSGQLEEVQEVVEIQEEVRPTEPTESPKEEKMDYYTEWLRSKNATDGPSQIPGKQFPSKQPKPNKQPRSNKQPINMEPEVLSINDDVYTQLRTSKKVKDLWDPLNWENVKIFIGFAKSISGKNDLYFKISDRVIEFLKLYSFLEGTKEKEFMKFRLRKDEFEEILCCQIYEDTLEVQMVLPEHLRIIPEFKQIKYGRRIQNKHQQLEELKYNSTVDVIGSSMKFSLEKVEPFNKWMMFDSGVSKETIMKKSLDAFILYSIREPELLGKNIRVDILMMMMKKLVFIEFNFLTNLEWSFMPNRLKRIRNFLTRSNSKQFYNCLEKAIKNLMEESRSGNSDYDFNDIKKSEAFKLFCKIEEGATLYELKHKK